MKGVVRGSCVGRKSRRVERGSERAGLVCAMPYKAAINAASGLIEEFLLPHSPGVPVSVLKAVVMVIEEALQEPDRGGQQATPAAQEVTQ